MKTPGRKDEPDLFDLWDEGDPRDPFDEEDAREVDPSEGGSESETEAVCREGAPGQDGRAEGTSAANDRAAARVPSPDERMTPPRDPRASSGAPWLRAGAIAGTSEPAPGTHSRPLSVAELNRAVRMKIEGAYTIVWIHGEISNLSRLSTDHLYFTLKEAGSEIASVMFAKSNRRLRFKPEDGAEVLACGRPTLWIPRGRYQFVVEEMEPRGRGSLLQAFEALKQRLLAQGLFDPSRKRPIPLLPRRIGVVTSPDGAALRDILKVLRRRHAGVDVLIAPVRVQGIGAAAEIAAAIKMMGRYGAIDVLIVGRGGGSIEDLWAFNEEIVARAIAACPVPVISAVGHETDVTIADFAADVRSATPSQAAELVVARREDLSERLASQRARLLGAVRLRLGGARRRLERLADHPALAGFPGRLAQEGQLLDELASRLAESMSERLRGSRGELRERTLRLAPRHLREVVRRRQDATAEIARRLGAAAGARLRDARGRAASMRGLLESLSPLSVLERGYAICINPGSRMIIRSAGQVVVGDPVEVRLARGQIDCRVLGTREAGSADGRAIEDRTRNGPSVASTSAAETRSMESREEDEPDEHGREDSA